MNKLSGCIAVATSIDDTDLNNVLSAVERYTKMGLSPDLAGKKAVKDAIASLKKERADMERLLQAQMPEVVSKVDLAPVAEPEVMTAEPDAVVEQAPEVVPEPVAVTEVQQAPEPQYDTSWIQERADSTFATIIPVSENTVLLRGFSAMTGGPVYAAASKSAQQSTRVDISSYTGSIFSTKELQALKDARAADLAKQDALFQANPDGPFSGLKGKGGVVAGTGVSENTRNYVAGLLKTLGMGDVRVLLIKSGERDQQANALFGPYYSAMSSGFDPNENGAVRAFGPNNRDFYINFDLNMTDAKMVEVLSHEVGHIAEKVLFNNASPETKAAIKKEYEAWRQKALKGTARDLVNSLRTREVALDTTVRDGKMASELTSYWTSFAEWFADNTARWATSDKKPMTLVEKFFASVAAKIKQLIGAVTGNDFAPNEEVAKFLNGMKKGADKVWLSETSGSTGAAKSQREVTADTIDVDGVARPTTDSTGAQISPTAEGLRNFWRWYTSPNGRNQPAQQAQAEPARVAGLPAAGGAVVSRRPRPVDSLGRPVRLYHGRSGDFGAFEIGNPNAKDFGWLGRGVYLTDSAEFAEEYATIKSRGGSGANVMPLYAAINNPYVATLQDKQRIRNGGLKASQEFTARLKSEGFDGVVLEYPSGEREYVAFEPSQVKSATGNNGNFDGASPEINQSRNSTENDRAARTALTALDRTPVGQTAIAQMVSDAYYNARESTGFLRFLTNDQIAEGYKLPAMQRLFQAFSRMGATANRSMERSAEVTKMWRSLGNEVAVQVSRLMLQSTLAKSHVSIKRDGRYLSADEAWSDDSNSHLRAEFAVPNDATAQEKATAAEGLAKARAEFNKLHAEFVALPSQARRVYDLVRDDLAQQRREQRSAFFLQAAEAYGPALNRVLTLEELTELATSDKSVKDMMQSLLGVAGTKAERSALQGLQVALRDVDEAFGSVKGPYFPLVRFGEHVVIGKAQVLLQAEQQAKELLNNLQALIDAEPDLTPDQVEGHFKAVSEARSAFAKARMDVESLKQKPSNYSVKFFESAAQAERALQEVRLEFGDGSAYRTLREDYMRGVSGAAPAFINKLEEAVATALDAGSSFSPEAKKQAQKAIRDLWLQQSPERSALRNELNRRGIDGVSADQMLRGYAQHSRSNAWRTSRLNHQGEVTRNLVALAENRTDPKAMAVLNEMKRRMVSSVEAPTNENYLNALTNTSYFWQLGLNASYFLTNATQAWTTSLPYMGGRHGFRQSAKALMDASKSVVAMLKQSTVESVQKNGAVVGLQLRITDEMLRAVSTDAGEYQMLRSLTDNGTIDITTKHDLGFVADGTSNIPVVSKVMELSSVLASYPEVYNRLATALAAYRMERDYADGNGETAEQVQGRALAYSQRVIDRTHFNYSQENAPRFMRGPIGRIVFQFRRYQQGMLYLFGSLIKNSMGEATTPQQKQEQAEARRALAYTLGTGLAVSGTAGLPIAAPVAMVAAIMAAAGWDDDDEPELLAMAYNGLKDAVGEDTAQVLVKGLPSLANIDLSAKMGQGNLLSLAPFAKTEGKPVLSAEYWKEVGFSLLGAGPSTVVNIAAGAGEVVKGDVQRGVEQGAPAAVANLARAFRIASEGEVTRKGDVLMTPDEFSTWDISARALGFQPLDRAEMFAERAAFNRMEQQVKDASSRLINKAARGEDVEEDIAGFNERNPGNQITNERLRNYMKRLRERQQAMREGIPINDRNEYLYRRLNNEE